MSAGKLLTFTATPLFELPRPLLPKRAKIEDREDDDPPPLLLWLDDILSTEALEVSKMLC